MIKKIAFLGIVGGIIFTGCYYDNKTDLYGTSPCDTTSVTYTKDIKSLVETQCAGCHGPSAPSAGVFVYDYSSTKACCLIGKFVGSVKQDGTASNMPKGSGKWSTCNINKIEAWVRKGCPE